MGAPGRGEREQRSGQLLFHVERPRKERRETDKPTRICLGSIETGFQHRNGMQEWEWE